MNPDNTTSWLNFAQTPVDQGGLGLAQHQAAGLVGNLVNESGQGLNPWGPTGDNGTAMGTAQWRGDRLQGLKDFAASNGMDHRSTEAQQAWMRNEMLGSENGAYKQLLAAKTPEDAASAVNQYYERSADTSGNREKAARQLMAQFGGAGGVGPGALALADEDNSDADAEDKNTGSLSTNAVMGKGALQRVMSGDNGDNKLNTIAQAMTGVGASLASISSPQQAYALNQQLQAMKKDNQSKYKISVAKDGRIVRVDDSGNVDVVGGNTASTNPDGSPAMLGDPSKKGDEYLKTLQPSDAQYVNGMVNGTLPAPPPSAMRSPSPRMQQLITAAKQVDPDFDPSNWQARNVMQKDLAKTSPATLGGILANGHSAFRHLGLASDGFVSAGNGNGWDGFGGNIAGEVGNAVKNYGGNSKRADLLNAANEEISKYGTESTKYYAGSPGGVHERAAAQKATDPWTATGGAQAGYVEASKNLMIERGKELEAHIRDTMGQRYLDKHPVFDDEANALMDRIDNNVAKLRGPSSDKPANRPSLNTLIPLN